ncbi:MAG: GNAT family N-acetyltransferase [Verrucomicrobiales bacterium]|nr:GNAT family N-acetyltransferase [Verrucomicrobiales bacterium]
MKIRIREIGHTAGLNALEREWDCLLGRSSVDSVFLTWEHARTWWEFYADGGMRLRVLLAEDETGKLVGIAPFMTAPGDSPLREGFRHLVMIGGTGDSLSEYLDLIIEPGCEVEISRVFARYVMEEMADDWDVLRIGMAREDSTGLGAFADELDALGVELGRARKHASPSLELSDSWESFLASRSQNFRRGVRVARRKLERGREVTRRIVGDTGEIGGAMDSLAELNRKRWGEEGASFKTRQFELFHRKLAERFLGRGWLYLSVIEADGVAVGARYDFVYGGKMWCFQGGWDPSFAKVGLGKVMVADVVEWAIGAGLSEYDFLGGDARYKREWSSSQRWLVDYEATNPSSVRGVAYQMLRAVKRVVMGCFGAKGKENRNAEAA